MPSYRVIEHLLICVERSGRGRWSDWASESTEVSWRRTRMSSAPTARGWCSPTNSDQTPWKIPDATTTRGRMWHSWSMINLYHTGSCLVLPMSSLYHDSDALLLKGWSLWQSRMVTTTKENRSKLVSCLGVQIEPGPSPISAILCDHAMFVITALWF